MEEVMEYEVFTPYKEQNTLLTVFVHRVGARS